MLFCDISQLGFFFFLIMLDLEERTWCRLMMIVSYEPRELVGNSFADMTKCFKRFFPLKGKKASFLSSGWNKTLQFPPAPHHQSFFFSISINQHRFYFSRRQLTNVDVNTPIVLVLNPRTFLNDFKCISEKILFYNWGNRKFGGIPWDDNGEKEKI